MINTALFLTEPEPNTLALARDLQTLGFKKFIVLPDAEKIFRASKLPTGVFTGYVRPKNSDPTRYFHLGQILWGIESVCPGTTHKALGRATADRSHETVADIRQNAAPNIQLIVVEFTKDMLDVYRLIAEFAIDNNRWVLSRKDYWEPLIHRLKNKASADIITAELNYFTAGYLTDHYYKLANLIKRKAQK